MDRHMIEKATSECINQIEAWEMEASISNVSQAFNHMENSLERLGTRIEQLEAKLSPILRDEPRVDRQEDDYPMPPRSPLATTIERQADAIDSCCDHLEAVLSLIDL